MHFILNRAIAVALVGISALLSLSFCEAAVDSDLTCSACRVLVQEVTAKIRDAEKDNKMVDSGSFRIDSKGNNNIKKVPYARSDTHLTSVLEKVCQELHDYGRMQHPDVIGKHGFVRLTLPDGRSVNRTGISTGSVVSNLLRMRCEGIVDDYEDDIKAVLRREPPLDSVELEAQVCKELATACSEEDLKVVFTAPAETPAESVESEKNEDDEDATNKDNKDEEIEETKDAENVGKDEL